MSAPLPQAAILCGGQGSRLRAVLPDLPKPMAEVAGRPFLEHLVGRLAQAGLPRVVLCAGYGADTIARHFHGRDCGIEVVVSAESVPLGTGGALANALPHLDSDPVLVLNGDSWVAGLELRQFFDWAAARPAGVAVVAVPSRDRADAGSLRLLLGGSGPIAAMAEKEPLAGAGFDNAGIYLIPRALLAAIPGGEAVSLERELLPAWIRAGAEAYVHPGPLLDIGTPERLRHAQAHPELLL